MRADITSKGELILTPTSVTEETMLNVWIKDKAKTQIVDTVLAHGFDEIGPACIKAIAGTGDEVQKLTGDLRKAERKQIKKELDELGVEDYNKRATNEVLKKILDRAKAAADAPPKKPEKQPGAETPPEPEPTPDSGAEGSGEPDLKDLDKHKAEYQEVYEALKAYAAIEGTATKEVIALLAKYDATKMSELKEESFPALLAELEKLNG